MNLSTLNVFRLATMKMGWLSERQGVLAQNIANADTPDYRAKDLKAPSFSKIISNGNPNPNHNVKMVQTAKGHMIAPVNAMGSRLIKSLDTMTIMIKKSVDRNNATNQELIKKAKKAYKTSKMYKSTV